MSHKRFEWAIDKKLCHLTLHATSNSSKPRTAFGKPHWDFYIDPSKLNMSNFISNWDLVRSCWAQESRQSQWDIRANISPQWIVSLSKYHWAAKATNTLLNLVKDTDSLRLLFWALKTKLKFFWALQSLIRLILRGSKSYLVLECSE